MFCSQFTHFVWCTCAWNRLQCLLKRTNVRLKTHLKINRMLEMYTSRWHIEWTASNIKRLAIQSYRWAYRTKQMHKYLPIDLSPSLTPSPLVIIDARIHPSIDVCHWFFGGQLLTISILGGWNELAIIVILLIRIDKIQNAANVKIKCIKYIKLESLISRALQYY